MHVCTHTNTGVSSNLSSPLLSPSEHVTCYSDTPDLTVQLILKPLISWIRSACNVKGIVQTRGMVVGDILKEILLVLELKQSQSLIGHRHGNPKTPTTPEGSDFKGLNPTPPLLLLPHPCRHLHVFRDGGIRRRVRRRGAQQLFNSKVLHTHFRPLNHTHSRTCGSVLMEYGMHKRYYGFHSVTASLKHTQFL